RSLKSPNPLLSHQNAPGAAAACGRATKNPARHPARAAGVASVNTLFWKILVTRVKRKVDEFDRGAFQAVREPLRGDAAPRSDLRSLKSPNPLLSHQNAPGAAAACGRATKNPARHPARAAGVASVNTLFWKILVTRVKRKVDEFDRGAFQAGREPLRGDAALR